MTNADLCTQVFDFLLHAQVETVVVCAGARNAPLIIHLEKYKFKIVHYFEERSAAFYAIGLMKSSDKPVAVITTSGTAVAELLPAVIESFYQGLPLILISADRPKSYRNSGAPQTINQVGIFSHYIEQHQDWDINTKTFQIESALNKPLHINICFDEPLIDTATVANPTAQHTQKAKTFFPVAQPADFIKIKNPFVLVGQIEESQKADVIRWLQKVKAPVYVEALSQLRGEKAIAEFVIQATDAVVKKAFQQSQCDSFVRIGNVPTLRFWRDLENEFNGLPVFNFTNQHFSGLARHSESFRIDFKNSVELMTPSLQKMKSTDAQLQIKKIELMAQFPQSEAACMHYLSRSINGAPVYLGNSLPIREWDEFSDQTHAVNQKVYANRGANGIDGQISTYLGWGNQKPISWCIVGDLTALYDLASLGLCGETSDIKRLVIINNFGGQIFNKVFNNSKFLNTHGIEFAMWAKMWKWDYHLVKTESDFQAIARLTGKAVIEIQPEALPSKYFTAAWDALCKTISF